MRTILITLPDDTTTTLQLDLPGGSVSDHASAIEAALEADLPQRRLRFLCEVGPEAIRVETRGGGWSGGGAWPWLEPGYVDGCVLPWIRGHLHGRTIAQVRTVHASGRSLVLRLTDTDGARVYFKVDGAPAPSEAALLDVLAPLAGPILPPTLAADPVRGWLLRADFGGTLLEDIDSTHTWVEAAATLARLQRRLEGSLSAMEGLVRDYRGAALSEAMVRMLRGEPEEAVVTPYAAMWCATVAGSGIPDSLVHQDFVACNVARTASGLIIFDWSDVVLGHPFFACDRMLDACWTDTARKSAIIDGYLDAWTDLMPLEALREVFAACQKLRVLYEDLRWEDELAGLPKGSEMWIRLEADRRAGLAMMGRSLTR